MRKVIITHFQEIRKISLVTFLNFISFYELFISRDWFLLEDLFLVSIWSILEAKICAKSHKDVDALNQTLFLVRKEISVKKLRCEKSCDENFLLNACNSISMHKGATLKPTKYVVTE